MAVDHPTPEEGQFLNHFLIRCKDAGIVHHLGEPEDSWLLSQGGEILLIQSGAGGLKVSRRHARRGHKKNIKRKGFAFTQHEANSLEAHHIGNLMRV